MPAAYRRRVRVCVPAPTRAHLWSDRKILATRPTFAVTARGAREVEASAPSASRRVLVAGRATWMNIETARARAAPPGSSSPRQLGTAALEIRSMPSASARSTPLYVAYEGRCAGRRFPARNGDKSPVRRELGQGIQETSIGGELVEDVFNVSLAPARRPLSSTFRSRVPLRVCPTG